MNTHYDKVKQISFDSFNNISFQALLDNLTNQGYVFSFLKTNGVTFADKQFECLNQKTFQELCIKFNISVPFDIDVASDFFPGQRYMFIAYNVAMFSRAEAIRLLKEAVKNLDG